MFVCDVRLLLPACLLSAACAYGDLKTIRLLACLIKLWVNVARRQFQAVCRLSIFYTPYMCVYLYYMRCAMCVFECLSVPK